MDHDARRAHRSVAGFTLLEVLLACTVLASMSMLLGVLWSTAGDRAQDLDALEQSLEAPRAVSLLSDQWNQRRVLAPGASSFTLEAEALEFFTARPLLDSDWPIVKARFEVRPVLDEPSQTQLVYSEWRVTDVTTGGVDARPIDQPLVLIDDSTRSAFEWLDANSKWRPASELEVDSRIRAIRLNATIDGDPISCVLASEASPSPSF